MSTQTTGTNFFTKYTSTVSVALTNESGNATLIRCTFANLPTGEAGYAVGCIAETTDIGELYTNTGSTTSAIWTAVSGSDTGSISSSTSPTYSLGSATNFAALAGTSLTYTATGSTISTGDTGETTLVGTTTHTTGSDVGTGGNYAQGLVDVAALKVTLLALTGTAITNIAALETDDHTGDGAGIFAPGIYTSASAIGVTANATITLDGAGDYVFLAKSGAITFGANVNIVLTNGATAARVFWVASTDLSTTGSTSNLIGNFIVRDATVASTATINGRILASRAVTVAGVANTFTIPGGTPGSTVISGTLQVMGKLNGQLYANQTGSAATLLKIHNHLTTASIGSLEAKGELINDTGTLYGTYVNYDYTPTSASVAPTEVQGSLSNIQLTAGKTMTAGNLVGFTGQAMNVGTLNGAGILQAGIIGSIAGAGANTAVSHMAGVVSSVGATVVNPSAGELSSYIATNLGTTVIDNLIKVVGNATTTNVFSFADTTGCAAGGAVRTATPDDTAVDSAGSLVIQIGSNTYKIPYFS